MVRNRQLQVGDIAYLTQYYQGNGRGLSTRKLLPAEWRIVKVTLESRTKEMIVLIIEPTALEQEHATRTGQSSGASGLDA